MSASYIHRDRLVLHQSDPILKLPLSVLDETPQDNYVSLSTAPGTHHSRLCDELPVTGKLSSPSPPPPQSQVSLRSPKMSPDSTLTTATTHLSATHFSRHSPSGPNFRGAAGSGSASSSTCESFLRTALLSDCIDKPCVGSSSTLLTSGGHHSNASDSSRIESTLSDCTLSPGVTLTASSHISSPSADHNHHVLYSSAAAAATITTTAPLPSSTSVVKKSSRRNPWGPETYSDLITVAIHSYPDQQATLQQIYDFIITHYDYFRDRSDPAASAGWKNSIRHNLSLHDRFTKCPKSSDNTKSSYWRINTEVISKPYVRRRACSMDSGGGGGGGGGMKRSSGCGKTGRPTGGCGSTRQQSGRQHEKLFGRTVGGGGGGGGLHALPELLPDPYSSQRDCGLASGLTGPDGMLFHHHRRHYDEDEDDDGHLSNPSIQQTLSAYFGYGSNGSADIGGSCNGTLWPLPPKPSLSTAASAVGAQSNYANPVTTTSLSNRPYSYEQLSGSAGSGAGASAFSISSDLHSTVDSTDQGSVLNQANSLIGHLLRSDVPSMNLTLPGGHGGGGGGGGTQRHTHSTQLSQSYLPNAFFTHHPPPPQSLLPNRLIPLAEGSTFLSPPPPQPSLLHPVDMRHHQTNRATTTINTTTTTITTTTTAAATEPPDGNHLHALYLQTNPTSLLLESTSSSATFGTTPWSNYAASHFAFSNPVSPYSPYLSDSQPSFPSFRSAELKLSYDRSMDRHMFMTGGPLGPPSPSTNSSTSSSTRSWRPPGVLHGSDTQVGCGDGPNPRSTQHHMPTTTSATTTNWLGRSGGAFQPCSHVSTMSSSAPAPLSAASLYYASELFTNPETCALDTPPYSHVKPEPLDTDMTHDDPAAGNDDSYAGAVGLLAFARQRQLSSGLSPGTADIDSSAGANMVYEQQQQQHRQQVDPTAGLLLATTRYHTSAPDYGANLSVTDVERYSMELEVSLEVAERIVNPCSRSADAK